MIAIAEKIIQQKEGPFDPSKFVDRYEDALKALIKRKQKGEEVEEVDEPDNTNVIDLMEALRASLGKRDRPPSRLAPPRVATCGAKTRQNGRCGQPAMPNGSCRFHGGLSTGPKTAAGIERHRAAVTIHGGKSREMREFRAKLRALQASARRLIETV